ncbi:MULTISPECIES: LexA family protein [Comamonas]|uniref:LexA family protein n=1 Tax=Comamonas TaxID=283 RepID=UPI00257B2DF6|nr:MULTISPECIES: translesion error-prone DNA polymerase V autoproteolytic subunit [Comamonas]
MYSNRLLAGMPVPTTASPIGLPLADCPVRAGFPSPAEDFRGERLDIASLLIEHPHATYLLRVAGPSMQDCGIDDGDLIVVDRSIQARHAHIAVAMVEGEITVKLLHCAGGAVRLQAGNPAYPDITPLENETLEIWGVVTACIKRFAR